MRTVRYFLVLFALICVFSLTVNADGGHVGDWDDLTPTTEGTTTAPETEPTTEEVTTAPEVETSTEEVTTDPETEQGTEGTTESGTEATNATQTEPESGDGSETGNASEPESESATNLPTQSGSANVTEQPSESGTQPEEPAGGIPMPVIWAIIAAVGIGGIVAVVVLLTKYFKG